MFDSPSLREYNPRAGQAALPAAKVKRVPASHDGLEAILQVDGASKGNPGPAGAGVLLTAVAGDVLQELSVPIPHATNNVAEYTALLEGLRAAQRLGLRRIEVRTDSELLFRQLKGLYRVKNPGLQRLYGQAVALIDRFEQCRLCQVPREQNVAADKLASAAAAQAAKSSGVRRGQGSLEL